MRIYSTDAVGSVATGNAFLSLEQLSETQPWPAACEEEDPAPTAGTSSSLALSLGYQLLAQRSLK